MARKWTVTVWLKQGDPAEFGLHALFDMRRPVVQQDFDTEAAAKAAHRKVARAIKRLKEAGFEFRLELAEPSEVIEQS